MSPPDERTAIYQDLHHNQIRSQDDDNLYSAELLLGELFKHHRPNSVLDVGCGTGTWLAKAREMGVAEVRGIEGEWLDRKLLRVPEECVVAVDLEKEFDLNRRFDLVISLEVAEHLHPPAAEGFVRSLTRHADVVLFSAAIPYQGGHHHVNEQFLDYWAGFFRMMDFAPVDFLREKVWENSRVLWWLRQNIVVFAKKELTVGDGLFAHLVRTTPLSVVHPEIYMNRIRPMTNVIEEHQRLINLLTSGTTFQVVREADGRLTINRLS